MLRSGRERARAAEAAAQQPNGGDGGGMMRRLQRLVSHDSETVALVRGAPVKIVSGDDAVASVTRQWADLFAAREHAYPTGGAAAKVDEFWDADPADFAPTPPDALPAEQIEMLEAALGDGPVGRWVRVAPRAHQLRPEGRLVVPRDEWVTLDAKTPWYLQFFLSLLPWTVPPPEAVRARRR